MTETNDPSTTNDPAPAPPPEAPAAPAAPPAPAAAAAPGAEASSSSALPKNPVFAAVLSLFPGMGHVYNGLYLRGVAFFLLAMASIYLVEREGLFGMLVAFVWIFNILDAYRQASLINLGYQTDLGIHEDPERPEPGQGALILGIALFFVGFIVFLEETLDIQIDWVWRLWPLGLMAVGGWLVFGAIQARNKSSES